MRIAPVNQNINFHNNRKNSSNTAPSFTAWEAVSRIKVKKAVQEPQVYHFTTLFRNPHFWADFSSHIQNKFPNGAKIYNYAASDGSESYSLIMRLIEDIGDDNAKKYFPIMSNDIGKAAVQRMKKRKIEVSKNEEESIFINLKKTNLTQYFDFIGKDPIYGTNDILKVKKSLYSKIIPKQANIMKDLEDSSMFQDPCVLLFRNAWYFFSKEGKNKLAEKLFDRLKPGSSLVIGGVDRPHIPPILIEKGFRPVKHYGGDQLYIFERP